MRTLFAGKIISYSFYLGYSYACTVAWSPTGPILNWVLYVGEKVFDNKIDSLVKI